MGLAGVIAHGQRDIPLDGGQPLGEPGLVGVGAHLFAQFALDLVSVGQHVFQGLILIQQLDGGFFTHAGHAGDIVAAVPHEALEIGDLGGRDAKELLDPGGGAFLHLADALAGEEQGDFIVHQLQGVPITGEEQGVRALFPHLQGESAQDVVRLVACQAQYPQAHGGQDLLDGIELGAQLVRRAGAARLVLRIRRMAEGGSVLVKGHGAPAGIALPHAAQQHIQKTVQGIGILALVVHQGQGVKGAVQQAVAVHDQKKIPHACVLRFWLHGVLYHISGEYTK